MSKLLARAGKGLTYKLPERKVDGDGDSDEESEKEEEEEQEEERPFEPLMVWQSPHNGGEAKGLPSKMYVIDCTNRIESDGDYVQLTNVFYLFVSILIDVFEKNSFIFKFR